MASEDDGQSDVSDAPSAENEEKMNFNMPLTKKETMRLTLRTHKNIGKLATCIRGAEEQYDRLRVAIEKSSDTDNEQQDKSL